MLSRLSGEIRCKVIARKSSDCSFFEGLPVDIVSTLIMSVMSRIKDIGILRSVGAKTKSILQIFIFQGMAIGLTGIFLGLTGGVSLALSLDKVVDLISRIIGRSLTQIATQLLVPECNSYLC